MTQYKATINGSAAYGTLTWNTNWTGHHRSIQLCQQWQDLQL
jgi:hypothetical protein